jgi:osmotically-inducible protein OsmY
MSQISGARLTGPASPLGASALQQQLRSSPYWSVRQLNCHVDQGSIVLRGTVPCFYLKQVAQSVAVKTVGVECVRSDIEVQSE